MLEVTSNRLQERKKLSMEYDLGSDKRILRARFFFCEFCFQNDKILIFLKIFKKKFEFFST